MTREEGETIARESGSLFLECSAKTKVSVREAFEELVKGVMENPSLMEETANKDGVKLGAFRAQKGPCCKESTTRRRADADWEEITNLTL